MPPNDQFKFQVNCDAGDHGQLRVGSESLVVNVGQRIVRDGRTELWDSVVVKCSEEQDGSCIVQVLLCNPDWKNQCSSHAFVLAQIQARQAKFHFSAT